MMLTILLCPALAKLFTPSRDKLDVNAQALLALEEGAYSGEYPSLRSHAAAARVYATDPDIIEMCERWITVADLSAKSGITRFAEADGLSGNLKLFFTGFVNPQTGIDALVLLGKEAWDGSNDIGSRIESRYRPLVDGYNSAVRSTRILVYVVTLGAAVLCCGYIIARSRKGDIPP